MVVTKPDAVTVTNPTQIHGDALQKSETAT